MHPRAIVGPPGTMPHLNPSNGMPSLRRTIPRPVSNPPPLGGGGRGIGPSYYEATGDLPPWCPYRAPNMTSPSGQTRVHVLPNPACHEGPVSVGACFQKFDPIKQYGVGLPPPPVPNPHYHAWDVAGPHRFRSGMDMRTGMPRLRSRIWYR